MQTIEKDVFIKDYDIDKESGKIFIQTDTDQFYSISSDNKKLRINFNLDEILQQKVMEGNDAPEMIGLLKDKIYLYFTTMTTKDDKAYIVELDVGEGTTAIILADKIDRAEYRPKFLDNYVYYYRYTYENYAAANPREIEKLCRLNVNTLKFEDIGDDYRHPFTEQ